MEAVQRGIRRLVRAGGGQVARWTAVVGIVCAVPACVLEQGGTDHAEGRGGDTGASPPQSADGGTIQLPWDAGPSRWSDGRAERVGVDAGAPDTGPQMPLPESAPGQCDPAEPGREDGICDCASAQFGTHTYFFCGARVSAWRAQELCESRRGYNLAILARGEENDFVNGEALRLGMTDPWIGLIRLVPSTVRLGVDQSYVWVDFHTVEHPRWGPGAPSGEERVYLSTSVGRWRDSDPVQPHAFVCESDYTVTGWPRP